MCISSNQVVLMLTISVASKLMSVATSGPPLLPGASSLFHVDIIYPEGLHVQINVLAKMIGDVIKAVGMASVCATVYSEAIARTSGQLIVNVLDRRLVLLLETDREREDAESPKPAFLSRGRLRSICAGRQLV